MKRTPLAAAAAIAAAGAIALIPQQALANGCLQAPVWDAATNTYTITEAWQLHTLSQGACDMTATIRLANDIDLTGTGEFRPIGSAANQNPFRGTFDGAGHAITGLEITNPPEDGFGLIGTAVGATIRNVRVTGTVSRLQSSGGGEFGALLVGNATDTTIRNASVSGSVTAIGGAGGLVGLMARGSITDADAWTAVTAVTVAGGLVGWAYAYGTPGTALTRVRTEGSVTSTNATYYAGGIVGELSGVTLSQSSSGAAVQGDTAGGLVGRAAAGGMPDVAISDSYATGAVSALADSTGSIGGIVGGTCSNATVALARNYFTGMLKPAGTAASGGIVGGTGVCFTSIGTAAVTTGNLWNSDATGPAGAGGTVGVGRTTAQMKQLATYTGLGWSIVNGWEPAGTSTWGICPQVNDGFPFLQSTGAGSACRAPEEVPAATPAILQATVLPSRRRVVSGQAMRIGIRARNTGGSAAASAVSCVRLPARLVLVRAPGAMRSGRVACFRLGTLAAGAQATRTVTMRAVSMRRASVTVTGSATASGMSRVNAAPVTVTVVPRAARARVTG